MVYRFESMADLVEEAMPWKETDAVLERMRFVVDLKSELYSMSELCELYNVSRVTGYKWLRRYEELGIDGMKDQSRAPKSCPHRTDPETCGLLLELKRKYPDWGAPKLLEKLHRMDPERDLPAAATVGDLLRREKLTKPGRRRRPLEHPGRPTGHAVVPNDLWTADFKGQFKTRDGIYCYPLTIADVASRFVFSCQGLASTKHREARPVFLRLFREFGLPSAIRTDNGTPFATTALGRLSRLSVWWIKLGIRPELIQPGHPEQNGIHERMHRTLGRTTDRPAADRRNQQREFRNFLKIFNHERPHDALGGDTPAERYQPSARPYPEKVPSPEYPGHYEVRRVSRNGGIKWSSEWVNISSVLAEEFIGLQEVDDGVWTVWFHDYSLGRFDERRRIVYGNRDPDGRSRR